MIPEVEMGIDYPLRRGQTERILDNSLAQSRDVGDQALKAAAKRCGFGRCSSPRRTATVARSRGSRSMRHITASLPLIQFGAR